MNHRKPWTSKEVQYLWNNYGVISLSDICSHLGRSLWGVLNKIKRRGVTRTKVFKTIGKLAKETGYNYKQIHRAIWALELTPTPNVTAYRQNKPRLLLDKVQCKKIVSYLHKHPMGKPHNRLTPVNPG